MRLRHAAVVRHAARAPHRVVTTMAAVARRPKVLLVVGTTGSGKSRLGIELAQAVGGEVINADVIQMYAGLDVASAKVPPHERAGVPHHLLSFLEPRTTFTVRDFRHVAGSLIDDVVARGRVPVVVGGTMYYCQSLLRQSLLEEDEGAVRAAVGAAAAAAATSGGERRLAPAAVTTEAPYSRLSRVDPVMAQRLHPNDARKIARALQVFDETGMPFSEVLRRQHERLASPAAVVAAAADGREGAPEAAAASPYDVHTIWLHVPTPAVLHSRLDARVDAMVAGGLLREVRALRDYLARVSATSGGSPTAAPLVTQQQQQQQQLQQQLLLPPPPQTVLSADVPSELTVAAVREYLQATHFRPRQQQQSPTGTGRCEGDSQAQEVALQPPFYWTPVETDHPLPQPPAATAVAGGAAHVEDASGRDVEGDAGGGGASSSSSSSSGSSDYSGLLQAIGFKELAAYLALVDHAPHTTHAASVRVMVGGVPPVVEPESVGRSSAPKRARLDEHTHGGAGPFVDVADASPDAAVGLTPPSAWHAASCSSSPAASSSSAPPAANPAIAAALAAGIAAVKQVTRRYAKKQDRWLRNRFLARGVRLQRLDTGDVGTWDARVRLPALAAVQRWLATDDGSDGGDREDVPAADLGDAAADGGGGGGGSGASPAAATVAAPPLSDAERVFAWRKHTCELCERTANGDKEWADHLRSRGHAQAQRWARERARVAAEHGIDLPKEGARARRRRGAAPPPPGAAAPPGGIGGGGAGEPLVT